MRILVLLSCMLLVSAPYGIAPMLDSGQNYSISGCNNQNPAEVKGYSPE